MPEETGDREGRTVELDEDVLAMVREQLDRDPPPSTTALYGRAAAINSDIYELSLRQFHAKYPLRVKRQKARSGPSDSAAAPRPDAGEGDGGTPVDGASAGEAPADEASDGPRMSERLAAAGDPPPRKVERGAATAASRGDAAGPDAGEAAADGEEVRERVRRVFWRVAREVARAETPGALVTVVERVPEHVDELVRIVGGGRPGR